MDASQQLVDTYLVRALEEFDTNYLSTRLMRRLAEEFPGHFLTAAMRHLNSTEQSGALRFLSTVAIRQEAMFSYLTSPEVSSRERAVNLFRRFLDIDPSFDVKLAERLPNRRESNLCDALDSVRSTRALDILDQTSQGRRLLPILGHLPTYRDNRISAKATLFVGRRVQNPSWTKKQLSHRDPRVRANAVEALWGLETAAAVNLLEDCSDDHNNRVLGNSLLGLHILGRGDAERRTLEIASDGEYQFRSTAAWILGKMAGPECLDCLTRMVRDNHPLVRSTALRSLRELRRPQSCTPVAIAARSQVTATPAVPAAAETVAQSRQLEAPGPSIEIRLDGNSFNVRERT